MKKNIAIIAGGDSSEIVVSLKSAEGIYSFIDKEKYNTYIVLLTQEKWEVQLDNGKTVPIDKNNFSFSFQETSVRFDFAYITIHGTPGENGLLQGYFELIGIPYSSCGVLASALTFNKYILNNYLRSFNIDVAESVRLFRGQTLTPEELSKICLPVFVKPNDGGSSFGASKVQTLSALQPAIDKAFKEGKEVIVEQYLQGCEITCGCYKTKDKEVVFPITEVVTDNEFFDFDAKYNGQVDEITPARISAELTEEIQRQTLKIYDLIGAKGLIRADYIITADNKPVLLEVNTTPGMTVTSFIPQQVRAAGLDIKDVMIDIIENEFN
ncbi:D-alanine--D-alanine ligase [Parabacteroides sp. OttesenSCG-928-G07]|nr:D-alanine--D-alanine ligase [Parabacteroides sp. OttesenSCG-928-G21]MDL2278680.1 D-alanine--D-alanine ligase [Parabacteroides sp. OttesenSCG-928-G07]